MKARSARAAEMKSTVQGTSAALLGSRQGGGQQTERPSPISHFFSLFLYSDRSIAHCSLPPHSREDENCQTAHPQLGRPPGALHCAAACPQLSEPAQRSLVVASLALLLASVLSALASAHLVCNHCVLVLLQSGGQRLACKKGWAAREREKKRKAGSGGQRRGEGRECAQQL